MRNDPSYNGRSSGKCLDGPHSMAPSRHESITRATCGPDARGEHLGYGEVLGLHDMGRRKGAPDRVSPPSVGLLRASRERPPEDRASEQHKELESSHRLPQRRR
jgi:hypothetical protein